MVNFRTLMEDPRYKELTSATGIRQSSDLHTTTGESTYLPQCSGHTTEDTITGAYSYNWFRCRHPGEVGGHCQRWPGGSVFASQTWELLALLGCVSHVFAQEGQPRGRTTVVKHFRNFRGTFWSTSNIIKGEPLYFSGNGPVHQMGRSISPTLYKIHSVGHSLGGWDYMPLRSSNGYSQRLGCKPDSSVIQHLCLLLDMEHTRTTSYHPQQNGQVERFKMHLGSQAGKGRPISEAGILIFPKFCLRIALQLMNPHNLPFPSDIWPISNVASGLHFRAITIATSGGGFVEETHQYINDAYATVCSNLTQAHQRQKLAFDKKENGDTFWEGHWGLAVYFGR